MHKNVWIALAFILAIAAFMRFHQLTTTPPGLYLDEAMEGIHALNALHTGDFKVFYKEGNGEEGLFAWTMALSIAASGGVTDPWILRFPSAVFGFLTVLGTFFVARELFKHSPRRDIIALLATFFIATSFWHIMFSRIGFRAITAPFFMIWSIYFFLKALHAEIGKWKIAHAIFGGIFFGFGFYSYISYRVMPLLFLVAIPFFRLQKNFWRLAATFVIAAFIVALPLGLYFLENPEDFSTRTSQTSVFNEENPAAALLDNVIKTAGMLNFQGDHNWRHNFSDRPQLFWPVGIVFWVGVIYGLKSIFDRKRQDEKFKKEKSESKFAYIFLFVWIFLGALPLVFSVVIPHALRAILMISPIMILAAVGSVWLFDWLLDKFNTAGKNVVRIVALVLLAFVAVTEGVTYFRDWANRPELQFAFNVSAVDLGYKLRNLPQETPKYVVDGIRSLQVPVPDGWSSEDRIDEHSAFLQPAMFITDTFHPRRQREQNMHWVVSGELDNLPPEAIVIPVGGKNL